MYVTRFIFSGAWLVLFLLFLPDVPGRNDLQPESLSSLHTTTFFNENATTTHVESVAACSGSAVATNSTRFTLAGALGSRFTSVAGVFARAAAVATVTYPFTFTATDAATAFAASINVAHTCPPCEYCC